MPNIDEAIEALLAYQQADMEGVMVLTSRQAIHEVADELKRLRDFEQWATAWHNTCETIMTLLDLPGGGSPQEMLEQVQARGVAQAPEQPTGSDAVADGARSHAQISELDDASNACLELAAKHGFATGHGDTVGDMIREFSGQIRTINVAPVKAVGSEALRLLAAEDARQEKLHELLETIREQIRLGVEPEHRPDGLFQNIQDAVYAMRGRTLLMNIDSLIGRTRRPMRAKLSASRTGAGYT